MSRTGFRGYCCECAAVTAEKQMMPTTDANRRYMEPPALEESVLPYRALAILRYSGIMAVRAALQQGGSDGRPPTTSVAAYPGFLDELCPFVMLCFDVRS